MAARRRWLSVAFLTLVVSLNLMATFIAVRADGSSTPPSTDNTNNAKDATNPSECGSDSKGLLPSNCLYLEEPINAKPGYDLFTVHCDAKGTDPVTKKPPLCTYTLYSGTQPPPGDRGPIQAILTRNANEKAGPFTLLNNYVALVYNYMSGLIIGISVLFIVIGGIEITISGSSDGVTKGLGRIKKALLGLVIWFAASLILYTINPTFFAF
jgi:Type IV secretion system pilin